jgi:hypothetical protein
VARFAHRLLMALEGVAGCLDNPLVLAALGPRYAPYAIAIAAADHEMTRLPDGAVAPE